MTQLVQNGYVRMLTDKNEAVEELVGDHGPMVYATAYRILGNPEDAEDAYQEVFLKLLRKVLRKGRAREVSNWGAFLRVLAYRASLDLLRKRRDRDWRAQDLPFDTADGFQPDPREEAERRQRAQRLRHAMGTLPRQECQVFALRHFEDFTYEQISEALGVSANHVGVILYRARARLKELLQHDSIINGSHDNAIKEADHVSE